MEKKQLTSGMCLYICNIFILFRGHKWDNYCYAQLCFILFEGKLLMLLLCCCSTSTVRDGQLISPHFCLAGLDLLGG